MNFFSEGLGIFSHLNLDNFNCLSQALNFLFGLGISSLQFNQPLLELSGQVAVFNGGVHRSSGNCAGDGILEQLVLSPNLLLKQFNLGFILTFGLFEARAGHRLLSGYPSITHSRKHALRCATRHADAAHQRVVHRIEDRWWDHWPRLVSVHRHHRRWLLHHKLLSTGRPIRMRLRELFVSSHLAAAMLCFDRGLRSFALPLGRGCEVTTSVPHHHCHVILL